MIGDYDSSTSEEFKIDGYEFVVISDEELKVEIKKYDENSSTVEIPSQVTFQNETYTVTSIGRTSFGECTSLKTLVIPDTIENIGMGAFYYCSKLMNLTLPISVNSVAYNNYTAFPEGNKIKNVTLTPGNGIGYDYYHNYVDKNYNYREYTPWGMSERLETVVLCEGIEYIGAQTFYKLPFEEFTIPEGVKTIGKHAFEHCYLKVIYLPSSLTSIEGGAFDDCMNLGHISMPENIKNVATNFRSCTSLKYVYLPDGFESIGERTFEKCTALEHINIPDSLHTIDEGAFNECKKLDNIQFSSGVTTICKQAFKGCESLSSIMIPENVKEIHKNAFEGCKSLISITLNGGHTAIGEETFKNCKNLKFVYLGSGVASIGYKAFTGCENLKELIIPISLDAAMVERETIYITETNGWTGEETRVKKTLIHPLFEFCKKLETLTFTYGTGEWFDCGEDYIYTPWQLCKSSIKKITIMDGIPAPPAGIFNGLKNLNELTIPIDMDPIVDAESPLFKDSKNLEKINFTEGTGEWFDCGENYMHTPWHINKDKLKTVIVVNGVSNIPANMFQGFSKLEYVILPEGIVEIGKGAFQSCKSLKNILIPLNLEVLQDSVFEDCKSLKSIDLPANLTTIGNYVFKNCESLEEITMPGVTSIGAQAFLGCDDLESIVFGENLNTMAEDAFEGFTFFDATETKMQTTVENLIGCTFTGKPSKMIKQTDQ